MAKRKFNSLVLLCSIACTSMAVQVQQRVLHDTLNPEITFIQKNKKVWHEEHNESFADRLCEYVFSYGADNIEVMATKVGADLSDFKIRVKPAKAHGYIRAFAGASRAWDSTSTATLVPRNKEDFVTGIAACLKKSEMERLDNYNEFPISNRREKIKIEILNTNGEVEETQLAQAYFKNDLSLFVPPSDSYLEAVAQNTRDYRELLQDEEVDATDIKIAVRYAREEWKILFMYTHKASESVKKAIAVKKEEEEKQQSQPQKTKSQKNEEVEEDDKPKVEEKLKAKKTLSTEDKIRQEILEDADQLDDFAPSTDNGEQEESKFTTLDFETEVEPAPVVVKAEPAPQSTKVDLAPVVVKAETEPVQVKTEPVVQQPAVVPPASPNSSFQVNPTEPRLVRAADKVVDLEIKRAEQILQERIKKYGADNGDTKLVLSTGAEEAPQQEDIDDLEEEAAVEIIEQPRIESNMVQSSFAQVKDSAEIEDQFKLLYQFLEKDI